MDTELDRIRAQMAELERRVVQLSGDAGRREKRHRFAPWWLAAGLAGMVLAPLPGGAEIPNLDFGDDFQGQISGQKMYDNFVDIEARLVALEYGAYIVRECFIDGDNMEDCDWINVVVAVDTGINAVTFDDDAFGGATPSCFCSSEQSTVWCNPAFQQPNSVQVEQYTGDGALYPGDGFRILCVAS